MSKPTINRRDFHRLSLAALGGALTGSLVGGCATSGDQADRADVHVCRGLNKCKGHGKGGDNACAGQGKCATAAPHACAGRNECKGQGGCGENPGQNDCKGRGHCAVPLKEDAWKRARAQFEASHKS